MSQIETNTFNLFNSMGMYSLLLAQYKLDLVYETLFEIFVKFNLNFFLKSGLLLLNLLIQYKCAFGNMFIGKLEDFKLRV